MSTSVDTMSSSHYLGSAVGGGGEKLVCGPQICLWLQKSDCAFANVTWLELSINYINLKPTFMECSLDLKNNCVCKGRGISSIIGWCIKWDLLLLVLCFRSQGAQLPRIRQLRVLLTNAKLFQVSGTENKCNLMEKNNQHTNSCFQCIHLK